jgi:hypothetical protein
MLGVVKGAGMRIQRQYPKAVPMWCAAHQLNRVIVQSCTEKPVRNMIGTVDCVSTKFEIWNKLSIKLCANIFQVFMTGGEVL